MQISMSQASNVKLNVESDESIKQLSENSASETRDAQVAIIGCEGDINSPMVYPDGSLLIRRRLNDFKRLECNRAQLKEITVVAKNLKSTADVKSLNSTSEELQKLIVDFNFRPKSCIKWSALDGYLPCLKSSFITNIKQDKNVKIQIEHFAHFIYHEGLPFEVVFSRVECEFSDLSVLDDCTIPKPQVFTAEKIELDDLIIEINRHFEGSKLLIDYAILADRFWHSAPYPSVDDLKSQLNAIVQNTHEALSTTSQGATSRNNNPDVMPHLFIYDYMVEHMSAYWQERISKIFSITFNGQDGTRETKEIASNIKLLDNSLKAGHIITLITRDDIVKNGQNDHPIQERFTKKKPCENLPIDLGTNLLKRCLHVGENGYKSLWDHDLIGIIIYFLTIGDFQYVEDYLDTLNLPIRFADANWKYSLPFAFYIFKTDCQSTCDETMSSRAKEYVRKNFPRIKDNTHNIASDRDFNSGGIMKATDAVDSNGFWTVDNWSALTGLMSYAYICHKLDEIDELNWAIKQYADLLTAVVKKLKQTMDKYSIDYIPMHLQMSNDDPNNPRNDVRDANWASFLLFGRWAVEGLNFANYLDGKLVQSGEEEKERTLRHAVLGDVEYAKMLENEQQMASLIDLTYRAGFKRRNTELAKFNDERDEHIRFSFGGYPDGYFCSSYNVGYTNSGLFTGDFSDLAIKSALWTIKNAQSGPNCYWESIKPPKKFATALDLTADSPKVESKTSNSTSSKDIDPTDDKDNYLVGDLLEYDGGLLSTSPGGGGSCPHIWGQSVMSKAIVDAFIFQKVDGSLIIGQGIPREMLEITSKNQPFVLHNVPLHPVESSGFDCKGSDIKVWFENGEIKFEGVS